MFCNICNKNPATIHIQEVINGLKKSLHICQTCADAKGISVSGISPVNIAELFKTAAGLQSKPPINQVPPVQSNITIDADLRVCGLCGWDSDKLKKTGRLGCPGCYESFAYLLEKTIPSLHRGDAHFGRMPRSEGRDKDVVFNDLFRLQSKMEKLVKEEKYEEAAQLRDKINSMKESFI